VSLAANRRRPTRERTVCPAAIRWELIQEAHQLAHTGAQRVLTKLQLWWYWPNMERDVRHRVKQCEVCQGSKHGRPPDEVGRRRLCTRELWQAKTADLVETTPRTPPKDVTRQENPLLFLEMRSPPSAFRLPPPLPGSETDPEERKPHPREGLRTEMVGKLHLSQTGWKHHPWDVTAHGWENNLGQWRHLQNSALGKPPRTERTYHMPFRPRSNILLGTVRREWQRNVGVVNTMKISTFALAESQTWFVRRK